MVGDWAGCTFLCLMQEQYEVHGHAFGAYHDKLLDTVASRHGSNVVVQCWGSGNVEAVI